MKFVKKPVVIEAVRWRGYTSNLGFTNESPDQPTEITAANMHGIRWGQLPDWLPRPMLTIADSPAGPLIGEIIRNGDCLEIGTLEGVMRAQPGDWIIRGVKGEIYPCKPDIFAATYEIADQ